MIMSSEEFKDVLSKGKYIFHLHTNYTDGLNSVEDYFRYALGEEFKTIIFTEHVRKNLSYNFGAFINNINKIEKMSTIKAIVGVEAKILPGGKLDISDNLLSMVEVICFACHSFHFDIELYKSSFINLFKDKKWKNHIRVWVHPGRFLKSYGASKEGLNILEELINIAVAEDIFIEKNLKEKLPPSVVLNNISPSNIIIGYDAHSIEEIETAEKSLA